jgi:hypothetical protein
MNRFAMQSQLMRLLNIIEINNIYILYILDEPYLLESAADGHHLMRFKPSHYTISRKWYHINALIC